LRYDRLTRTTTNLLGAGVRFETLQRVQKLAQDFVRYGVALRCSTTAAVYEVTPPKGKHMH
jgi:hypothetical protein